MTIFLKDNDMMGIIIPSNPYQSQSALDGSNLLQNAGSVFCKLEPSSRNI
jgi:hypothetical protein